MKNEIIVFLIGNNTLSFLIAGVIFAIIGAIVSLLIDVVKREPNSPNSPVNFSFRHLIKDNYKKFFLSLLLILLSIRFCKEIFNIEPNMFICFIIGLISDQLALIVKSKTSILKQ